MAFLIDTCLFIAEERKKMDLCGFLESYRNDQIAVSVITVSEMLHGIHRAKDSTIRNRRQVYVEEILRRIPVLDFDMITARVYAQIWAELAKQGKNIAPHDLQIAATAIQHNLALVTLNTKDFSRVSGLKIQKI